MMVKGKGRKDFYTKLALKHSLSQQLNTEHRPRSNLIASGVLTLGLKDSDNIGQQGLGALDALGVVGKHDSHLDTEDALSHHHVTDGGLDVLLVGVTGLDHVTIGELLGLGSLASDLAGHGHLSTLGAGLHDEAQHTVASTANGKATEQLVLKGLSLGLGVEASVGDAVGEDLNGTLGEVESLLDDGGQLSDSLALLAKDILSAGGLDDDLDSGRGHADLKAGITILSELSGQELKYEIK